MYRKYCETRISMHVFDKKNLCSLQNFSADCLDSAKILRLLQPAKAHMLLLFPASVVRAADLVVFTVDKFTLIWAVLIVEFIDAGCAFDKRELEAASV
jgi:hypothetical protein